MYVIDGRFLDSYYNISRKMEKLFRIIISVKAFILDSLINIRALYYHANSEDNVFLNVVTLWVYFSIFPVSDCCSFEATPT